MAARLVNDLPCFELRMGNRIEAIPALIGDLLARLPASRLNRAPS
jgi:hypothetical protein